jgi:hypothetical protein
MFKNVSIFALLCLGLSTGGCVALFQTPKRVQWSGPAVVFQSMSAGTILACVDAGGSLSHEEFNQLYGEAVNMVAPEEDNNIIPLVCLGLNPQASNEQFEKSIKLLEKYTLTHPDDSHDLKGLQSLLTRLNQAKINKQLDYNKMRDKKKNLEKQIEQLKNIEKIITNKEHTNPGTK